MSEFINSFTKSMEITNTYFSFPQSGYTFFFSILIEV